MSSPEMDCYDLVAGTAPKTTPDRQTKGAVVSIPEASRTARAVFVVAVISAGFWYLLWRLCVHLLTRH